MAQDRMRKRADVLEADVVPAAHQGPGFSAEHEVLRRPHARAVRDPLLDEIRRTPVRAGPAGADDRQRVLQHFLGHGDFPNQLLKRDDVFPCHGMLELVVLNPRRGPHDLQLLLLRQVIHDDVEHESVELGLGQRIRAFQLDGVLRGEDEERFLQGVRRALHGDLVFLHRLQQGSLGFRRRPVDLVRQHDVGEDRALHEHHLPPAGLGILLNEVRAGDVGRHQIRRELDPGKFQIQNLGDGVNQQSLGQSGYADDEAIAAHEKR